MEKVIRKEVRVNEEVFINTPFGKIKVDESPEIVKGCVLVTNDPNATADMIDLDECPDFEGVVVKKVFVGRPSMDDLGCMPIPGMPFHPFF